MRENTCLPIYVSPVVDNQMLAVDAFSLNCNMWSYNERGASKTC